MHCQLSSSCLFNLSPSSSYKNTTSPLPSTHQLKADTSKKKMVPVVDLAGDFTSPSAAEAEKLRKAAEEWGCFRIAGHGVPLQLLAEMKKLVAHLFDLPVEIKQKNISSVPFAAYVPSTPANPHHEGMGVFDVNSELEDFLSQLQLSTPQRETIEKYCKAIHELFLDVTDKLAKSMGYQGDPFCEGWAHQLKLNHYLGTAVGLLGLSMHTDSCFMTVLQDDEHVGGMEVMDQSGEFVGVDPAPGTLFVNLGDCATVWSNGRIRTVPHQVQCKEANDRYSIATFFSPHKDMVVEPPKEFIDSQHPRLYSPLTYEELRLLRTKHNLFNGKILDLLRVEN